MPMLRKLTAKMRKHRYAWEADSPESEEYRKSHAANGGMYFSIMRGRTQAWVPRGPRDTPIDEVSVSTMDIAHYFFSALLDDSGPVVKNDDVPDGNAKEVWRAITASFYNNDFGEIANRIVESMKKRDLDGFSSWLWDKFMEGLEHVENSRDRDAYFEIAMKDWDLVKAAHLATIEGLARIKVKFDFVPSCKFETRRAGRSSGSEAPTSKGRGKRAQMGGSGRSAPTAPTRD